MTLNFLHATSDLVTIIGRQVVYWENAIFCDGIYLQKLNMDACVDI